MDAERENINRTLQRRPLRKMPCECAADGSRCPLHEELITVEARRRFDVREQFLAASEERFWAASEELLDVEAQRRFDFYKQFWVALKE